MAAVSRRGHKEADFGFTISLWLHMFVVVRLGKFSDQRPLAHAKEPRSDAASFSASGVRSQRLIARDFTVISSFGRILWMLDCVCTGVVCLHPCIILLNARPPARPPARTVLSDASKRAVGGVCAETYRMFEFTDK